MIRHRRRDHLNRAVGPGTLRREQRPEAIQPHGPGITVKNKNSAAWIAFLFFMTGRESITEIR